MQSPFESVARAAIEEILQERLHKTKHGYLLTQAAYAEVVDEIFGFLKTSRTLKEKGDKIMGGGPTKGVGKPRGATFR